MALEILKPHAPKKTFILGRTLHLTGDGQIVEEDDARGVKVLGATGKAFYEEEAKALGLNESHRLSATDVVPSAEPAPVEPEVTEPPIEDVPKAVPEPAPAPEPAPSPEPQAEPESEQSRATHRRR